MPSGLTGLTRWAVTGAVLAAAWAPWPARAEEPERRPAAAERQGGAEDAEPRPRPQRRGGAEGEEMRGGPEAGQRRAGPDGANRRPPAPGQVMEHIRGVLKELKLTDEQKTKVEAALKTAGEEFRELRDELESMEPRDRRDRVEELFAKMRQEVHAALTEEQRQTLRKRMAELRPGGGGGGGGDGNGNRPPGQSGGPATRPGAMFERLQESLKKLDLSEDQKTKIQAVFDDVKAQVAELREGLIAGDEAAREKMGQVGQDVRRQLGEILTQDQRDRLREMMAPAQPPPGEMRPRDRARKGGDGAMAGEGMMEGEMRDAAGARQRGRQRSPGDEQRGKPPTTAPAPGAKIGTPAPAFELTKLDGKPVRLSSFAGRVGVIVFGSYSSPSFRQRAAALEELAKRYGSRAQFLIVYTKEAHPAGEWDVERNKDEGIAVEQHKDAEARTAQANKAKETLKLTIPIAPDTMDDAVSNAYGAFPNGAVVLSRDGVIVARQQWADPSGLAARIDQALKTPTSKPAS